MLTENGGTVARVQFGTNSEYYYKYLAGLTQSDASRGWQHLVLHPQVFNPYRNVSICANLSSVQASIVTPRGVLSGAWCDAA